MERADWTERISRAVMPVSYTHLRAHETGAYLVCRLLLEKQMQKFDLAGSAGQIYLSEYQAEDNRFLFADKYLSRTADATSADSTPSISMTQTEQSDMLSRLKKQIGILFDGVELN